MLDRFKAGLAGLGQKGAGLIWSLYGAAQVAWQAMPFSRKVRDGYRRNSAVWACIRLWARAFPEPPLMPYGIAPDGARVMLPRAGPWQLLARPNAVMGEDEFWAFVVTYMLIGGNAYIVKERARNGQIVALWPLHDGQMAPVSSTGRLIERYSYDPGDGRDISYDVADVIQLRWAPDPDAPARGMSPLEAAARPVDTDNEALRAEYALLRNDGAPRTLVVQRGGGVLSREAKKQLRAQWAEDHGGDMRGGVGFVSGDVTIERVGVGLTDLALEALHNIPESRISAAFEVPAVLANLNIGLQRAINANAKELREMFTESALVPRWRNVAAQMTAGLRDDWGLGAVIELDFDLTRVRALEDDVIKRRASIKEAVAGGWMTVNEARELDGLKPDPGGDVYLRAVNLVPELQGARPVAAGARGPGPADETNDETNDDTPDGLGGDDEAEPKAGHWEHGDPPAGVDGHPFDWTKATPADREAIMRAVREKLALAQDLAPDVERELGRLQALVAARAAANGGGRP